MFLNLSYFGFKLFAHVKLILHYSCSQVAQWVILGHTVNESVAVPTTGAAIVCTEAACALQECTAASATCVSSNLTSSKLCVSD